MLQTEDGHGAEGIACAYTIHHFAGVHGFNFDSRVLAQQPSAIGAASDDQQSQVMTRPKRNRRLTQRRALQGRTLHYGGQFMLIEFDPTRCGERLLDKLGLAMRWAEVDVDERGQTAMVP